MEFKNKVQRVLGYVTKHLGEDAVYTSCNSAPRTVRVVFDNDFEIIDPDTETVISSQAPVILVRLSDFGDKIRENERFNMDGIDYKVWSVQEDGQGGARVTLHRLS
jgi:DNA-binding beta-propeller fold protein YncE